MKFINESEIDLKRNTNIYENLKYGKGTISIQWANWDLFFQSSHQPRRKQS